MKSSHIVCARFCRRALKKFTVNELCCHGDLTCGQGGLACGHGGLLPRDISRDMSRDMSRGISQTLNRVHTLEKACPHGRVTVNFLREQCPIWTNKVALERSHGAASG